MNRNSINAVEVNISRDSLWIGVDWRDLINILISVIEKRVAN